MILSFQIFDIICLKRLRKMVQCGSKSRYGVAPRKNPTPAKSSQEEQIEDRCPQEPIFIQCGSKSRYGVAPRKNPTPAKSSQEEQIEDRCPQEPILIQCGSKSGYGVAPGKNPTPVKSHRGSAAFMKIKNRRLEKKNLALKMEIWRLEVENQDLKVDFAELKNRMIMLFLDKQIEILRSSKLKPNPKSKPK